MLCFDGINELILLWVDQVNYITHNTCEALYFVLQDLKKKKKKRKYECKTFSYTSLLVIFLNMWLHAGICEKKER
jgi:hypothetical protein